MCTVYTVCTVSPAATAVMSREADSQAVKRGEESELPSHEPGKARLYCAVLCKGNYEGIWYKELRGWNSASRVHVSCKDCET